MNGRLKTEDSVTKYICIIILITTWHVQVSSQTFVNESKIDSLYKGLSIEQKVKSILISPLIDDIPKKHDSRSNWLNMDKILSADDGTSPLVSDMLMRSAFLNGNNGELKNQLSNLLLRKKGDGVYFRMQSPYSLLFKDESTKTSDFFLEPIGRLVVPFTDKDRVSKFFQTKLYKMPQNILSQHGSSAGATISAKEAVAYVGGSDWKNVQKLLKEYENPTLETILQQGGLIFTDKIDEDYNTLIRLFENTILPLNVLEQSCKKRLRMNELLKHKPATNEYLTFDQEVKNLVRGFYKKGAVLLQNKNTIPLNKLAQRTIASVHIGVKDESVFQKTMSEYAAITHFRVDQMSNLEQLNRVKKDVEGFNTVIVGVNGDWLEQEENKMLYAVLHQLSSSADLLLVHFGSGNGLASLPDAQLFKAVLLSYDTNDMAQEIAAQIVFGGVSAQGILAQNINKQFSFGVGEFTQKCRLGYAPAYEIALSDTLKLIDQLAYKAIRERATPGCCVLVVKDGDVIYNKAFGYHTYDKKQHVSTSDLYDIASVTKIMASVPSVMKMYDERKVKLDDKLGYLLPRLKATNKASLRLDDILLHQAGLQSWIPFYIRAIDKSKLIGEIYGFKYSSQFNLKLDTRLYMNKTARYREDIFRHTKAGNFDIEVSSELVMNRAFVDSMRMAIDTLQVQINPKYMYSDLGYYYIKDIIEKKSDISLDSFVENTFYKPLGADRMLYKPLDRFSKKDIVPTENDVAFRKELIHGYVHDPGAAMLGGVAGHAGVFASAPDLAKMLQMYLYKGSYGGEKYINASTIKLFTSVYKEGNRRGLGFDKPVLDPEVSGPSCHEASPASYGHSGFTGTLVWVDPEYDLIYIFLSNRVHPDQYNKKLITDGVRTKIQSAIYRSLPEYWENKKEIKK